MPFLFCARAQGFQVCREDVPRINTVYLFSSGEDNTMFSFLCARSGFPGMQRRCASNKYGLFVFERRGQHDVFFFYCCFLVSKTRESPETGREKVC